MPKVYPDISSLRTDINAGVVHFDGDDNPERFRSSVGNRNTLKRQIALRNRTLGFGDDGSEQARPENWKDDAWRAYEQIEAIAFAIDTVAKGVAAGRLVVGLEQKNGAFKPTDAELPNEVLRDFRGPHGCHYTHLLEHAATILQITGDGYFVSHKVPVNINTNTRSENGDEEKPKYIEWEFVSDQEITVVADKSLKEKKIYRDKSGSYRKNNQYLSRDNTFILGESSRRILDESTWYVRRGHRENKRFTDLSDSALKKNLAIVREILKLTNQIHSVIDSKMPAGILIIPEELTFGQSDILLNPADAANGEPAEYLDQLDVEIIEHFAEPIDDHSSPEHLVPLLIRGGYKYLDEIRYLDVSKDLDIVSHRIRDELFQRLFIGLDIPKEMIEGKGSLNHWTGRNIDSDLTSNHVIPLGELISRLITKCYFRPMLTQRGMSEEEAEKYTILYDASSILPRQDKSTIAMKLYELEIISEKALLEYSGFEPTDAPSENERRQRLIFKLILSSPVTLAPLLMPKLDGLEDVAAELERIAAEREAEGGGGPQRNKRVSEPAGDDGRGRGLKSLLPSTSGDNEPRERSADLPPSEERRNEAEESPEQERGRERLSDNAIKQIAHWLNVSDNNFDGTPLEGMSDEEAAVVVAEMISADVEPVIETDAPVDLINGLALTAAIVRSQVLAISTQRVQAKAKRFEIGHLDPTDNKILAHIKDLEIDMMETTMDELLTSSPMDRFAEYVLDEVGHWMKIHNDDDSAANTAPILAGLIISDLRTYIEATFNIIELTENQALTATRQIMTDNFNRYFQEGAALAPVVR